jgi:hypothetical protein
MAAPEAYSYYFGLGVAIVLGYVLSSLRIERLLIAAFALLPEQFGGRLSKEQKTEEHSIAENLKIFSTPSVLSGLTEENIYELERRAIFSKACDLNVQSRDILTGNVDLAFRYPGI